MTQYTNEETWTEFQSSFWTSVRTDDSGVEDSRQKMLREYCELQAQQILDYFTEPHDFAAIISTVVGINDSAFLAGGGELILANEKTLGALRTKAASSNPLLKIAPGHPIGAVLTDLLRTEAGCRFYIAVALILAEAAEDEEFSAYIYK